MKVIEQPRLILSERQQIALARPCVLPVDHALLEYKRSMWLNDTEFWTILTFDAFPLSTCVWHAAIAICEGDDFKAVNRWDHNDKCATIDLAKELLEGVGFANYHAQYETIGIRIRRAASPLEIQSATIVRKPRSIFPLRFRNVPELEKVITNGRTERQYGDPIVGDEPGGAAANQVSHRMVRATGERV